MRRLIYMVCSLTLLAVALVACNQQDVGAKVEQGGQVAQEAGTSLGIPLLALAGSIASSIGALLAGKKAGVAQQYAHTPFTLDEAKEMADLLETLGRIPPKAPKA